MGGTAEFGWGPGDPVDEGQVELQGVVFTESSGGSPLASAPEHWSTCYAVATSESLNKAF